MIDQVASRAAVVGLGQMGQGIARRLDTAGLLAGVWDTNPAAMADAGLSAHVQPCSVSELLAIADVILFAVPTTQQIASAFADGASRKGCIVVDLTTSHPDASRALSRQLASRGMGYLDASMTGGAAGADAGTLTLMVGGSEVDLAACRPALDAIAKAVFHLGPVGSGHAMKLIHNHILHASFLATCEGLRIAERAGLDLHRAVDVLNAGNARSFVTEVRFPRDILSGTMLARSRIANLEKDLGLAQQFAADLGASAPYGALTHALLARATATGRGETDFSHLFPLYDELVEGSDVT